jgi:uncharacterized oligopeptide transporter (OPT) family protein
MQTLVIALLFAFLATAIPAILTALLNSSRSSVIPLVFRSRVAVAIPLALSIKRHTNQDPESESAREKCFAYRQPHEI